MISDESLACRWIILYGTWLKMDWGIREIINK